MVNEKSGDSNPNEVVADAPAPFTGANIASAMPGQRPVDHYADHPVAGVATPNAPSGGRDESIPVTTGNHHMLLGVDPNEAPKPEPGTNPGLERTVGQEGSAAPIRQEGNTVILDEDTRETDRPEFAPGLPKPRTDPDADPHEKTDPPFQGFDKINPLPLPGATESIEHRGAPNEPRVVGVQAVGDIRVIGSESSEAKNIDAGMSPEAAQAEAQHPSPPSDADDDDDGHPKRGHLPEDFPARELLEANELGTYAKLRKRIASDPKWYEVIDGIGKATAEKIEAAMNE